MFPRLILKALALLPIAHLAWAASASSEKSVNCVQVSLQPMVQQIAPKSAAMYAARSLRVILLNQCGVDITAFVLTAHLSTGRDVTAGDDLLPRLLPGHPLASEIPAAGKEFAWDLPLGARTATEVMGTVTVDALVFADRTAAGDPKLVANFVHVRKFGYQDFLKKYEFLKSVEDFEQAKIVLGHPAALTFPAPALTSLQAFFAENQRNLNWADPASWADWTARRENETAGFINLFKLHSVIENGEGEIE